MQVRGKHFKFLPLTGRIKQDSRKLRCTNLIFMEILLERVRNTEKMQCILHLNTRTTLPDLKIF